MSRLRSCRKCPKGLQRSFGTDCQVFWEFMAAISAAAAAIFAAWSAWTSRASAKAARLAVEEARLAIVLAPHPSASVRSA
jgi:hypothetical protein